MHGPGRGDEKLHRAVSGYVCGFLMLGRHIQRRNAVNVLALDIQDLPARGQNGRSWAHAYDSFRQPGCCVDHVLAIVENQQKFLCSDRPDVADMRALGPFTGAFLSRSRNIPSHVFRRLIQPPMRPLQLGFPATRPRRPKHTATIPASSSE